MPAFERTSYSIVSSNVRILSATKTASTQLVSKVNPLVSFSYAGKIIKRKKREPYIHQCIISLAFESPLFSIYVQLITLLFAFNCMCLYVCDICFTTNVWINE